MYVLKRHLPMYVKQSYIRNYGHTESWLLHVMVSSATLGVSKNGKYEQQHLDTSTSVNCLMYQIQEDCASCIEDARHLKNCMSGEAWHATPYSMMYPIS